MDGPLPADPKPARESPPDAALDGPPALKPDFAFAPPAAERGAAVLPAENPLDDFAFAPVAERAALAFPDDEKPPDCVDREGDAERNPAVEPLFRLGAPDWVPKPEKPCFVPASRDEGVAEREAAFPLPPVADFTREGGGAESDRGELPVLFAPCPPNP